MTGLVHLRLTNIAKSYSGRTILKDISVEADSGSAVAVMGPNGSGKSTILRMVAGLLRPSNGTITIQTDDGEWSEAAERRRVVAYAAPDLTFYPELTGRENLSFFEAARGRRGTGVDKRCREALERVGLGRRGDDPVGVYSSGMRQRIRLAFAWMDEAPVLLLDEPSLALDAQGVTLVAERIAEQRARGGVTLLATNDADEAKLGDRAIVLHNGRLVV